MSDEKFLCQNVGLGSTTQAHDGRRSVEWGTRGTLTTPRPGGGGGGVSIGNVIILFQFIKQIYKHI